MTSLVLAALLAQMASAYPAAAPSAATPTTGAPSAVTPTTGAPTGAATIVNSGSTNTAGYTLVVAPDGTATVAQDGTARPLVVATPQAHWLFAKLREADPVDSLGGGRCMKSASFGTSTVVTWNARTSSDLSCDDSPAGRELLRTIRVIVRQLALPRFRHRRLLPP